MEGTLFTMMILGIVIIIGVISIILGMIYLINEVKDTFGFIINLLDEMFKVINTIVTKVLGLGDTVAGLEKQLDTIIKFLDIDDGIMDAANKVSNAAKDVGNKTIDTANDVGNKTTDTVKKVGKKLGF